MPAYRSHKFDGRHVVGVCNALFVVHRMLVGETDLRCEVERRLAASGLRL